MWPLSNTKSRTRSWTATTQALVSTRHAESIRENNGYESDLKRTSSHLDAPLLRPLGTKRAAIYCQTIDTRCRSWSQGTERKGACAHMFLGLKGRTQLNQHTLFYFDPISKWPPSPFPRHVQLFLFVHRSIVCPTREGTRFLSSSAASQLLLSSLCLSSSPMSFLVLSIWKGSRHE